jgi:hypothetical protein
VQSCIQFRSALGQIWPRGCFIASFPLGPDLHRQHLRLRLHIPATFDLEALYSNTVSLSLVPARRSCLPRDPGASYFINLRRQSNRIFWSSVCSSDRGFSGPPQTDALRGLHLGARIHGASVFPPPAAPSTSSPWTPSLSAFCFKRSCAFCPPPEDLCVTWLL